jgi:enoyl-CoA hydratase/carnithine racemase
VTSNNLVLLERRADGVAVITLNNPKVNALSQAVLAELRDIAHDLTNNRPGAVVVTGGERIFAAGADISEFSQYPGEKEFLFVPMSYVQGEERCRVEIGPGGGVLKVISARININIKTAITTAIADNPYF